jgi:hypothetical protein
MASIQRVLFVSHLMVVQEGGLLAHFQTWVARAICLHCCNVCQTGMLPQHNHVTHLIAHASSKHVSAHASEGTDSKVRLGRLCRG